jgi:hypothetical protein
MQGTFVHPARSIPAVTFRIPDLMQIASRVMEQVNAHRPDAVFVDGNGIGWGGHSAESSGTPTTRT